MIHFRHTHTICLVLKICYVKYFHICFFLLDECTVFRVL